MENRETVKQALSRVFVLIQQLEIQPTEHNVTLLMEIHKGLRGAYGTINAAEVQTTEVQTDEGDKTAD